MSDKPSVAAAEPGGKFPSRNILLGHAAMSFAALAFSGWNIIAKAALDDGASPVVLGLYRDLIATPLLALACIVLLPRSSLILPERHAWPWIIAAGMTGVYCNQLLFVIGLQMTSSDIAAFFQPVAPTLTLVIAICIKAEPARALKLVGVALGVVGTLLMVGRSSWECLVSGDCAPHAHTLLLGEAVLFAGAATAAVYPLLLKPLYKTMHPLLITFYAYSVGTAALGITAVVWSACDDRAAASHDRGGGSNSSGLFDSWAIPHSALAAILYGGVLCSCFVYALMTWANSHIDASLTSLYTAVQPVATALLSYTIFGVGVSLTAAAGAFTVCVGLCMASYAQVFDDAASSDSQLKPLLLPTQTFAAAAITNADGKSPGGTSAAKEPLLGATTQ